MAKVEGGASGAAAAAFGFSGDAIVDSPFAIFDHQPTTALQAGQRVSAPRQRDLRPPAFYG